jgi:hypothetical protein
MTRLQSLITAILVIVLLLIVVNSVFAGKILLDGLGRYPTKLAIDRVYVSMRHGDVREAGKRLMHATQMAIEGGVRWQVASFLLQRTSQLKSEGQLSEAVKTCWAASDALAGYDSKRQVYRECMDLFWEARGY